MASMVRFKLRTLLILLAVGPILLAGAWWGWKGWRERVAKAEREALMEAELWEKMRRGAPIQAVHTSDGWREIAPDGSIIEP